MTGLNDTDIRLDENWNITQATDGDAPLCAGLDCLYQNILLEAITQKGDLFYDSEFGWSLYDFIQAEDSALTEMEIAQRARVGLSRREVILSESITVTVSFRDDMFRLYCAFRFEGESDMRQLNVVIDAVGVEVVSSD